MTTATVTDAWFIPDQPNSIQDDAAQPLSVRDGGFTLALKLTAGFDASKPLGGILSVRDRAGMEADVTVSAARPGRRRRCHRCHRCSRSRFLAA